jgi:CBS domain-containing protein
MGAPGTNETGEMKRVEEIMIPLDSYPSVRTDQTLREAVAVIEGTQLDVGLRRSLPRALLVVDESRDVVGIVRRRDIMRGLEPRFLVTQPLEYRRKLFDVALDANLAEFSYDHVVHGIRSQAVRPVSDVMLPIKVTIRSDDYVMKAIYEMVAESVSLIPVVQDGRVVGVLRSVDVFHELAGLLS